ncbi:hypothetical protein AB0E10_38540 [Streptomyces sp. NPDC048045]|uniref:hypothetical protein n=1 Tax=Streptomyces sp. NPDC048045 TaxID=3154710 RepID=UPI003443F745
MPRPPGHDDIESAFLQVRRRNESHTVPLDLEDQWDGTTLLTTTTALCHPHGDDPQQPGLRVGDGLWRLTVVVSYRSGSTARFALVAPPAPAADGPTLPTFPSAGSGAVFRMVRSLEDRAMLKVTGPRRQAELTGFTAGWDRVTVHGRLIAAGLEPSRFTAEAVPRTVGSAVPVRPGWQGNRFTFEVPLSAMSAGGRTARVWDLRLRSGRTKIRIGRRLTDVRHPGKVFRTPFHTVALPTGELLRVHAHVSGAGWAAVSCTVIPTLEDRTR